jgi:hypothetical protein
MGFRKYVTKNEHRENDQEEPQTCTAMRIDVMSPAPVELHGVKAKPGEWVAIYEQPGCAFACVYTDAEFNELYELAPDAKREWLGG